MRLPDLTREAWTRDAWLARRREMITASDVPAILRLDDRLDAILASHVRRDPLAVYAEKLGHAPEETEAMARGRDFEAPIARAYERQTGRSVAGVGPYALETHRSIEWLGATPDRYTRTTANAADPLLDPLQIKLAQHARREWVTLPLAVQIQCKVEIEVVGASMGAACAWHDAGPLSTHDVEADRDFIDAVVLPVLERFRWHIMTRTPPEATSATCSAWALRTLFPGETGETVELVDADTQAMADRLEALRFEASQREDEMRRLRHQLMRRLGEASFGRLGDGTYLKRRKVERVAYEVKDGDYWTLSRERPKRRMMR